MFSSKKRVGWVDFGKGITILFVMLVHVIEGIFKTNGYTSYANISKVSMAIIFTGVSRSLCKKGLPFLHKIKSFQSKSDSNVSLTCPNPR